MSQPTAAPAITRDGDDLQRLVGLLTLEQKVALLTGETAWRLRAIPEIGLRSIAMSDGPVGVRGLGEIPDETSALFPSPSAVAATWDVDLAVEVGRAFGREAREHGVDVVLAPQVNIQRTPVGGRHFECFSEDPLLTSVIGTGVVSGIQQQGVAACIKHYIANDSETDRTSYVSRVDERAFREVYLAPFEHAISTVGPWTVMASYNRVDDGTETSHMTDHRRLLTGLLKDELGFDGAVVSDWMATRTTAGSANGGLDIVMPGPGGPWEGALLAAVSSGEVPEEVIDDKVARILRLARRVGALDLPQQPLIAGPAVEPFIASLAARSTVVIKRDDADPVWDRRAPATIALIGPNAVRPHVLGGGSSTVHPPHIVPPEAGLRARFPAAELTVRRGGDSRRHAPDLDALCSAEVLDAGGTVIATHRILEWDGWLRDLPSQSHTVRLRTDVDLVGSGEHYLEVATVGGHRIRIADALVHEEDSSVGVEVILDSSINNPDGWGATVAVEGTRTVAIEAELRVIHAGGYGALVRAALRHRGPGEDGDSELAAAVAAAAGADLTVVVVGTNEEVESEGWDRADLELPGRQNELVEAVLDADPDAVIVVNAGAPVILPWLTRAKTVLWMWFPGQEAGHSLAAVLAGDIEPAGRLPWTLPADPADVPVPHALPVEGLIEYTESVHVGYRAWERDGLTPAAAFGHGLGWTDWSYRSVDSVELAGDGDLHIELTIANTGARVGRETVQLYLEPPHPDPDRPARWLAGFASAEVAAGEARRVPIAIPRRSFEVWDAGAGRWTTPPGDYRVRIGRSVRDLRLHATVHVGPS